MEEIASYAQGAIWGRHANESNAGVGDGAAHRDSVLASQITRSLFQAGKNARWLLGRAHRLLTVSIRQATASWPARAVKQPSSLSVLGRVALGPRQTLSLVQAQDVCLLVAAGNEGAPSFFALTPQATLPQEPVMRRNSSPVGEFAGPISGLLVGYEPHPDCARDLRSRINLVRVSPARHRMQMRSRLGSRVSW